MVLLTIFWDSEDVVHTEFLEQGNTVNSTKYVNTLEKMKARFRRVRSEKVSIIHHDNARPHTSLETRTALDHLGLRTLPHPPYSPDLGLSDFFLFSKTQGLPQGQPLRDRRRCEECCSFLVQRQDCWLLRWRHPTGRPSVAALYRTGRWLCWKMICHLVLNKITFHLV